MIDLKPIQYAGRLLQTLAQIKLKTLIIRGQQATARRKHAPLHTTKKIFQRRGNIMDRAATTTTGFKRALIARQKLVCLPKIMLVVKTVMVVGAGSLNLRERPSEFRKRLCFI
jgi:hypothetical protein